MRAARVVLALALALALTLPAVGLAQALRRIEAGRAAQEAGDTARARAAFTEAVSQGDPVEAALGECSAARGERRGWSA
jgi:hypothetical protein